MASKKILVQLDIQAASNLTSPLSGFVGFSAKADGLYQKIGTAPELRLLTSADVQNAILADGSITGAVSQAQIFTMGVKLYNLTQGYIPYASGATKLLSNSPIYTDGTNVGIGTTSLVNKLDVMGSIGLENGETISNATNGNIRLAGSGPTYNLNGWLDVKFDSDSWNVRLKANPNVIIWESPMYVTTNVPFALGTANAGGLIYSSAGNASLNIYVDGNGTAYRANNLSLVSISRRDSNLGLPISADPTMWFYGNNSVNNNKTGRLQYMSSIDAFVVDSKSTHLVLNPSGSNVGIGTTTPGKKLSVGLAAANGVDGDILSSALATGTGYGSSMIWNMYVAGGNANSILAKIQPSIYQPTRSYLNSLDFFVGDWDNNNYAGTAKMTIQSGGNVGIGTTSPTASLHIKAGTATANTAPIKLTSGVNLTTPESGAIEFSSSRLYFTPSTTRETVAFLSDITSASHSPVTIGAIGSAPNANGMSISGQTLSLQPASATYGGIVTTGTQTLAGAKTLSSLLTASAGIANNGSYTQSGTSVNTFTGSINGPGIDSFVSNGSLVNKVITPNSNQIIQSPISGFLWHDVVAFNKNGVPLFETSSDGITYTTSTLDNRLFSQIEAQTVPIINPATTKSIRWTWSSGIACSFPQWLILGITYASTAPNITVLAETSDGITWTNVHNSTGSYNATPAWFYLNGMGNCNTYFRITIVSNNAGLLNLSSMRLLTTRWGDQGLGSEKSFPYVWDSNQNMTFPGKSTFSNATYSALFTGGNVGIGTSTPTSLLSVGATSQFQVNTTGAIVAATGITSSGTINFSSLTASKVVFTNASKNLTSTGIGTASQFIKGDGSLDSNTYITSGSISGFVPYTGAIQDVNLGTHNLSCNEISAASRLTIGNTNTSSYTDGGNLSAIAPSDSYAKLSFYSKDTFDGFGITLIIANPEEGISLRAISNDNSSDSYLEVRHWELGFYTNLQKRLEIAQSGSINAFGNTITSTGGFIGNASTATKLQTARTITIGNQSLSFDGTQNLSYTLNDIGYLQTRIGSNTYSYLSGDIILQGSGKIFINQTGQFITVNSYGYTKEDVGLGNVTNNAQWHNGNHPTTLAGYGITDMLWSSNYHPTTIAGYGITDALTVSGLATNNIPKWNGTTFVNGPLTTNANNSYISTNAYFNSNIGVSSPIFTLTNNNTGLGQSYIIYDRFSDNDIKSIGAGYDEGYVSILPENGDGLNVMIGSMSGARNLYVTGGTSTSSIALRSGAVTGYYLKCVNANGVAEWSPVTASQIYKGTWNASTNTPYLSNGSGTAGWYYRVTTAGTFNSVTYSVGDDIIYNGSIWERIPGAGYSLQTATTTVLGGVKIDGTSVKLNASNQLYVSTNYEAPLTFTNGLSRTGNTVSFSGDVSGFVPYVGATQNVNLGSKRLTADNICVTTGSGAGKFLMDVTGQGHAAWSNIPVASSTVIGGIKVGYGLQIDTAVLSVNPGIFIPYVGADRDVNLASHSIYAYDFLIYSDINLKCNIEDIEMKKLDISYKQFEYKTSRGEKRYGVIAQELLSIAPEFVSESNNSYAVKYTDLLIYEVAQLKEEVKQLKSLLCR